LESFETIGKSKSIPLKGTSKSGGEVVHFDCMAELAAWDTGPLSPDRSILSQGVRCVVLYSKYWIVNRTSSDMGAVMLDDENSVVHICPANTRSWLPSGMGSDLVLVAEPGADLGPVARLPGSYRRAHGNLDEVDLSGRKKVPPQLQAASIAPEKHSGKTGGSVNVQAMDLVTGGVFKDISKRVGRSSSAAERLFSHPSSVEKLLITIASTEVVTVGSTVLPAPKPFVRTVVLQLVPRLRLQNHRSESVYVCEGPGTTVVHEVQPEHLLPASDEKLRVLNPQSADSGGYHLCLATLWRRGSELWTPPFSVTTPGRHQIRVPDGDGSFTNVAIVVSEDGNGLITIQFSDVDWGLSSYRIVNNMGTDITIKQAGHAAQEFLAHGGKLAWTWYDWHGGDTDKHRSLEVRVGSTAKFVPVGIDSITYPGKAKTYPHGQLQVEVRVKGQCRIATFSSLSLKKNHTASDCTIAASSGKEGKISAAAAGFDVKLELAGIGVAFVTNAPREILYLAVDGITLALSAGMPESSDEPFPLSRYDRPMEAPDFTTVEVAVQRIQCDNRCAHASFATVLSPEFSDSEFLRGEKLPTLLTVKLQQVGCPAPLGGDPDTAAGILQLQDLEIAISALKVTLDEGTVVQLLTYIFEAERELGLAGFNALRNVLDVQTSTNEGTHAHKELLESLPILPFSDQSSLMYVGHFVLKKVTMVISIRSSANSEVQFARRCNPVINSQISHMYLFTTDISNTQIDLTQHKRDSVYEGADEFLWSMVKHWLLGLGSQLHRLLFSVDVLINPIGLLGQWVLAFWDLVYSPYQMSRTQGISGFFRGLVTGVRLFIRRILHSTLQALGVPAAGWVRFVDTGSQSVILAPRCTDARVPTNLVSGIVYGLHAAAKRIVHSWVLIFRYPIFFKHRAGLKCLPLGLVAGVMWAAASTAVAPLALLEKVAAGVDATMDLSAQRRIRPARTFNHSRAVDEFTYFDALGCTILASWARQTCVTPLFLLSNTQQMCERVRHQVYGHGADHMLTTAVQVPLTPISKGGWKAVANRPTSKWRQQLLIVSESSVMQAIVIISILVDILAFFLADGDKMAPDVRLVLSLVVLGIMAIDVAVRFLALGAKVFFSNKMNSFDLAVVIGTVVDVVLAMDSDDKNTSSATGFRLVRPVLKWMRAAKFSQIWRLLRIIRMLWGEMTEEVDTIQEATGTICILKHHVLYFHVGDELDWMCKRADVIGLSMTEGNQGVWWLVFELDEGAEDRDGFFGENWIPTSRRAEYVPLGRKLDAVVLFESLAQAMPEVQLRPPDTSAPAQEHSSVSNNPKID